MDFRTDPMCFRSLAVLAGQGSRARALRGALAVSVAEEHRDVGEDISLIYRLVQWTGRFSQLFRYIFRWYM